MKITEIPHSILVGYSRFVARCPAIVMITSFVIGTTLSAVAFTVSGFPSMGNPRAGLESRDGELILDILTWTKLHYSRNEQIPLIQTSEQCSSSQVTVNNSPLVTAWARKIARENLISVYLRSSAKSIWTVGVQKDYCQFAKKLSQIAKTHGLAFKIPALTIQSVFNNMMIPRCNKIDKKFVKKLKSQVMKCAKFTYAEVFEQCRNKKIPTECRKQKYKFQFSLLPVNRKSRFLKILLPLHKFNNNTTYKHFLKFYDAITSSGKELKTAPLVGIDARFREKMFSEQLKHDLLYVGVGLGLICLLMVLYTNSPIFVLATLTNLGLAAGMAYFVYTIVLGIDFFPFVNLFAFALLAAVGADNAFVVHESWVQAKEKIEITKLADFEDVAAEALPHAISAMFVTSITTTASLFVNMVSPVMVIKCFGLFAGFTILICYLLVITWLVATVIFCKKVYFRLQQTVKTPESSKTCRCCNLIKSKVSYGVNYVFAKAFPLVIYYWRYPLIILFLLFTIGMVIAAFVAPALHLPYKLVDRRFVDMSNPETYYHFSIDKLYRKNQSPYIQVKYLWGFNRGSLSDLSFFDPKDRGKPFTTYTTKNGGKATKADYSTSTAEFLNKVAKAVDYMHAQPKVIYDSRAPHAASWVKSYVKWSSNNSRCRVVVTKSCIITWWKVFFQKYGGKTGTGGVVIFGKGSSNGSMLGLYVTITLNFSDSKKYHNLKAAKDYAQKLQTEISEKFDLPKPAIWSENWPLINLLEGLNSGLKLSIVISIAIAFVCVLAATGNITGTIVSLIVIGTTVIAVLGILALLEWQLNIVECILIILSVGLCFDFTLHYSVAFKHFEKKTSSEMSAATTNAGSSAKRTVSAKSEPKGKPEKILSPSDIQNNLKQTAKNAKPETKSMGKPDKTGMDSDLQQTQIESVIQDNLVIRQLQDNRRAGGSDAAAFETNHDPVTISKLSLLNNNKKQPNNMEQNKPGNENKEPFSQNVRKNSADRPLRYHQTTAAVSYIGVPVAMGALTTAIVGICLLIGAKSLPFHQIGIFLVVVIVMSWVYSTFFYMTLIVVVEDLVDRIRDLIKKKKKMKE